MYESDRRRAAPLTSLYMQRTPAARAVSPRMARTDAIQRPVEPPNPPIVESAQPVLPLGGAPIQARISPGSKPERIARRRAQRAAQPAVPDGEAIAAMEYEVNHPIAPPPEPAFGEDENNPPPEAAFGENENNPQLEPEAVGPAPAPRRPGFWDREYAEGSVLGGIQSFRNRYLSLEGAAREEYRDDIAHFIGRVPTRDEVRDNRARRHRLRRASPSAFAADGRAGAAFKRRYTPFQQPLVYRGALTISKYP